MTLHYERDLNIPKYRQIIMDKIEQDLVNDPHVSAVFYGGSIGNDNTDLYSDIDLRIVVNSSKFEKYRSNKRKRAENWGNVLFFEDFPWLTYSIAHYDHFLKVDSFYYKEEDIKPSIWLQNIRIVYDQNGFMEGILKQSATITYHPSADEVEIWRTKFFSYVHEAYRRVQRREIYYALQCLDHIRLSMVTAWYMEKGIQPNAFGDWSKYEGERSELSSRQLSLLAEWHSSRDTNELMGVIRKVIPEFKLVHRNLCDLIDIEEDSKWIDHMFSMVF